MFFIPDTSSSADGLIDLTWMSHLQAAVMAIQSQGLDGMTPSCSTVENVAEPDPTVAVASGAAGADVTRWLA